nr:hypothetical protein [Tanacetum cinerariifolium]
MKAGGKDHPPMLAPASEIPETPGTKGGSQPRTDKQRFVTLVKQSQELKTVSYHKLYDILKQHRNAINEIRVERLACTTYPLVLVSQQQPAYHTQLNPTHYTQSSSTRSQAATKNKGKAIANSPPPTYVSEPKMVANNEASSKEKEIDKLMAIISMSFKNIYKPTNNNLKTLSNTWNTNVDNTSRTNRGTGYDKQTKQYDNQKEVNIIGAKENVGTHVVHQTGIQCYNYKEFRHVARECKKEKRPKDSAYHKKKMLLCKREEFGIQLSAEQADWRDDTDDEPEDQELEEHYMYMEKIQEHPKQPESVNYTYLIDQGDTNIPHDSSDMSNNSEEADQDDDLAK